MTTNREANYQIARDKAAETLRQLDPKTVTHRSAAAYRETAPGRGEFTLTFWDEEYQINWPDARMCQRGKIDRNRKN